MDATHDTDTTDATTDSPVDTDAHSRADRWGHLPARPNPADYVESQAEDPPPSTPTSAGDPDTAWMLRYS